MAIQSFKDRATAQVAEGRSVKGFPADLVRSAFRRLRAIHAAERLDDLRSPPGHHLEALKADRSGQHSIRINDQWRICFVWKGMEHMPSKSWTITNGCGQEKLEWPFS